MTDNNDEQSRISRRPLLKLLGVAAVPVAAQGVQASDGEGYGSGAYGDDPYGGSGSAGEPTEPSVETGRATDVTESSATLHGQLADTGGADSVTVSFVWREPDGSWQATASQRLDSTTEFDHPLEGLASETEYEFQAVADTGNGERVGERRAFVTDPAPVDESPSIDEFSVSEDSPPNPHADLHVDWAVSSERADLERATIAVFESAAGGSLVESTTVDLAGMMSASGSESIKIKHGAGDGYRVTLEVANDGHTVAEERDVRA